jgi:transforming growth factor-beta-induced protein
MFSLPSVIPSFHPARAYKSGRKSVLAISCLLSATVACSSERSGLSVNENQTKSETIDGIKVGQAASGTGSQAVKGQIDQPAPNPENAATEPAADLAGRQTLVALASKTPSLSILTKLVVLCDLAETLDSPTLDLTVFAPTNSAFIKLFGSESAVPSSCDEGLKTVLLYHVLDQRFTAAKLLKNSAISSLAGAAEAVFIEQNGQGVLINRESQVVIADVNAVNGVAHLIDTVLIPDQTGTLLNAIQKRPLLSKLADSLVATHLEGALEGADSLTVFAPEDKAFRKLGTAPLPLAKLKSVLLHHVVQGQVRFADIKVGTQSVPTLNGTSLSIFLAEGPVAFAPNIWGSSQTRSEDGFISEADIFAKNGVIHTVSQVLVPNNL